MWILLRRDNESENSPYALINRGEYGVLAGPLGGDHKYPI